MFLAGWKKCLWTKFIPFSIHYVLQNETLAAQIGSSEATLYQVQMGVMINWGENPFSVTSNPSLTQEVDISPFLYSRSYERHQVLELSHPLLTMDYVLVFRMPGHGSRLFLLSRPFNISVLSVTCLFSCRQIDGRFHDKYWILYPQVWLAVISVYIWYRTGNMLQSIADKSLLKQSSSNAKRGCSL